MHNKRATDIICGLLILLFLYAAITKLADYGQFRLVLGKSPLIAPFAPIIAWALPVSELGLSGLLFLPATRGIGLWISTVLLLLFTWYLSYILYFAPTLPCSCGGVLQHMTWKQHIIFNTGFTLLSLTGILLHRKSKRAASTLLSATGLPAPAPVP